LVFVSKIAASVNRGQIDEIKERGDPFEAADPAPPLGVDKKKKEEEKGEYSERTKTRQEEGRWRATGAHLSFALRHFNESHSNALPNQRNLRDRGRVSTETQNRKKKNRKR
jgi:hypothetical protein